MSRYTVERVLFEIASAPKRAAAFRDDAPSFLADFPLEKEEVSMLANWDVARMQAHGADPMLTMRAHTAVAGRERLDRYMQSLQHAAVVEGN